MRPNARQFRRHARELDSPAWFITRARNPPSKSAKPRQHAPRTARITACNGFLWIDSAPTLRAPQSAEFITIARGIEARAMNQGWVSADLFRDLARREFLAPYNPAVALYARPAPQHREAPQAAPQSPLAAFALSFIPPSWIAQKAEPFRPQSLADFVILTIVKTAQSIADSFKPSFG